MKDCTECKYGGKPSMGKLRCARDGDEVEVDFTPDGVPIGFTWAEHCPHFKLKEVSE